MDRCLSIDDNDKFEWGDIRVDVEFRCVYDMNDFKMEQPKILIKIIDQRGTNCPLTLGLYQSDNDYILISPSTSYWNEI